MRNAGIGFLVFIVLEILSIAQVAGRIGAAQFGGFGQARRGGADDDIIEGDFHTVDGRPSENGTNRRIEDRSRS